MADVHISSIQATQSGEEPKDEEEEEVLDEETKRRDQMVKGAIDSLIREYSSELSASSQDAEAHQRKKRKEKKEVFCSHYVYDHTDLVGLSQ